MAQAICRRTSCESRSAFSWKPPEKRMKQDETGLQTVRPTGELVNSAGQIFNRSGRFEKPSYLSIEPLSERADGTWHIPHQGGGIFTSGDQRPAIGSEGQGKDLAVMTPQPPQLAARGDFPKPDAV